jgi:hypothetical protein
MITYEICGYEMIDYEMSDDELTEYDSSTLDDFSTSEYAPSLDNDVMVDRSFLHTLARCEAEGHATTYLDHMPDTLVDCLSERFPRLGEYPHQQLQDYVLSRCA